jgi:hypothetical protein
MGHMRAIDAATTMTDMAGIERAMSYHLTANHYPPVPESMVPVCIEAVMLAADIYMDDVDGAVEEIELPEGVSFRGRETAPISNIIEAHHLDAFIDAEIERRISTEEE